MLRRASADNKLDDYTDAKDIGEAYVEAVGVMTGLEIVDGMTETTIDPTATYTREQAAKIIAYMVLGKSAADSLTCTVAPFDDVAADRWSAGYISFCVEQGIIDGMTDTTFEPTGTLTGFQWAKMLLSAVGFNAKGEFTGDSWSLNTARVAHSVGLFSGDAAGADHVALQRQQAMLYAFNTLTSVGCVVYSEALGDYIYNYNDFFWDRYTYEGTLGWNVFGLDYVYGVIRDNEGMGNATTDVSTTYDTANEFATINADTDAFMMYHGVRIWYVDSDGRRNTQSGDSVYVNDLASVNTLTCPSADEITTLQKTVKSDDLYSNWIGNGAQNVDPYEFALIDNSAVNVASNVDNYAGISYYFLLGELGTRFDDNVRLANVTKSSTALVDYDDIWTAIDDIHASDDVVYMVAGDGVYYIYATSATSGAVEEVLKDGTIVLTDGTEIAKSVLAIGNENTIVTVMDDHNAPNYSFVLDTHGHWIGFSDSAYRTLGWYTGNLRDASEHGSLSDDIEFEALFIDVDSGEPVYVPVTRQWAYDNDHDKGYYDITDELYNDTRFYPEKQFTNGTVYNNEYYYAGTVDFNDDVTVVTIGNDKIVIDNDDVTYRVVSGKGAATEATDYTGLAELIAAYTKSHVVGHVVLNNVVLKASTGSFGNLVSDLVFSPDADMTLGGIVYFAKDIVNGQGWDGAGHSYRRYNAAYLNGEANPESFYVDSSIYSTVMNLTKGFYEYTLDAETGYAIKLVKTTDYTIAKNSDITGDIDNSDVYVKGTPVSADVVVADIREDKNDVWTLKELSDFMTNDYNWGEKCDIVYFVEGGYVTVIYVVDEDEVNWTVSAASEVASPAYTAKVNGENSVVVDAYNSVVTVSLSRDSAFTHPYIRVTYNTDGATDQYAYVNVKAGTDNSFEFEVRVTGDTAITVTAVQGQDSEWAE